eukprot:scaffold8251_cov77-Phaeocystis_antarctica.AAC.1
MATLLYALRKAVTYGMPRPWAKLQLTHSSGTTHASTAACSASARSNPRRTAARTAPFYTGQRHGVRMGEASELRAVHLAPGECPCYPRA